MKIELKKQYFPIAIALFGSFLVAPVEAALELRGSNDEFVYNPESDTTFARDANLFKTQAANNANLVNSITSLTPTIVDPLWGPQNLDDGSHFDTDSGSMTWFGAVAWITWLNDQAYGGQSNWQLPEILPVNGSSINYLSSFDGSSDIGWNNGSPASALGNIFYTELSNIGSKEIDGSDVSEGIGVTNLGPFQNLDNAFYWYGSEFEQDPSFIDSAWGFSTSTGAQGSNAKPNGGPSANTFRAWAVLPGEPVAAVVPLPAPVWLFGSALTGLIALGRRRAA